MFKTTVVLHMTRMRRVVTKIDAEALGATLPAKGGQESPKGETAGGVETYLGADAAMAPPAGTPPAPARPGVPGAANLPDNYLERLSGLIPAEIIAAYAAISGILQTQTGVSLTFYWFVFLVLLAFTVPYSWKATRKERSDGTFLPTPWLQIVAATVSFVVWVFALGGPFTVFSWYEPYYGSVILVLYTLLIPLLVS